MTANDMGSKENDSPASSSPSVPKGPQRHSFFSVPEPVKRIFDKFPLLTYQANELPQRSLSSGDKNVLYVFTTERGARKQDPSFNPSCLKWQAYLKFSGIKCSVKPSNNHASPSGSLPFLLPAPTSAGESRPPIPSPKLQKWVKDQGNAPVEPENMRYEAYISLLDYRIRHAWLYTLYLDEFNFHDVAQRLYITPCSSNPLVQMALAHQLQQAAKEELQKHAWVIDGDEIILEAKLAFEALSILLGQDNYFFETDKPGLFDASVFAYTHLLLDKSLGWKNQHLASLLRKFDNLVSHRERILDSYFGNR